MAKATLTIEKLVEIVKEKWQVFGLSTLNVVVNSLTIIDTDFVIVILFSPSIPPSWSASR